VASRHASDSHVDRQGWKVIVPGVQTLDAGRGQLAALAAEGRQPEKAETALSRLRVDLTWMQVLADGGTVVVEADEWITKSSGRGDVRLIAKPADGGDVITGQFTILAETHPYARVPLLFPWATLHLDEEALNGHDEDDWMQETGIWDSEDKRHVGNVESFEEWRASRYPDEELRPYGESMDEVAHWRLWLELNDLGRAVITLEQYLAES
jgi:hypothetical protein